MRSIRNRLFGTTVLAGLLLAAVPAAAQTAQPLNQTQDDADELGEIVVTGSLIRRDPVNAPTPLTTVSRDELLTTGQTTVIDYLATIPALSNSVVPSDTTGSGLGDGGLDLPNLRSLGSGRTLTLVDGRRHVGSNGGSLAVDVSSIPRLLIQNVEIVTGGASSIYGADAVSGVLNFIMRRDFEGLEIDANYGEINSGGEATQRVSALIGKNFMDDRLNVYLHSEFERADEVTSTDVSWLEDAPIQIGLDADPTNVVSDGVLDSDFFTGLRRIDRPRWGQTTLASMQQPSPLNDPDVALASCTGFTSANCYGVTPGKTFWYDPGTGTGRLADFGQRIGNTGVSRPYNYNGDGENPSLFSTGSRTGETESYRAQTGVNFEIAEGLSAYAEAKYVKEETFDVSQPTFFDINLVNSYGANVANIARSSSSFDLRYSDNAFLPANVKAAIASNTFTVYSAPTATSPGVATSVVAAPYARHSMFGPDRSQDNERELQRYVAGFRGDRDNLFFVKDWNWDLGYTYGKVEVRNTERGLDIQRFWLASDAVVDTAGLVNGTPGQIVCRAQLISAQGLPVTDYNLGGDLRTNNPDVIRQCVPLNIFGKDNQSAAALEYIDAAINVRETNEQQQALFTTSGQLWDFWGAGAIGVALGGEYRKESTSAIGRSADTGDRFLFLNTGPDFPEVSYESKEVFAELSIPLFRDFILGEYAELSGSYRYADYSTVGEIDVSGVNLVWRPIRDITFKTSYNTSVRVPDLNENFSPFTETFQNGFVDPCTTLNIAAQQDATIRANRIANCTALAAQQGLTFDFAGATATNVDDFNPVYGSGISGVSGGNPALQPEESNSFTFSTTIQPRFIPNLALVFDYFEIEIENVIASVTAQTAANNCVNGPTLNSSACDTIFRNNPDIPFGLGAPQNDPIGGFIQGSINYAALTTRGIDFKARYNLDMEDAFGRDWGRLDYSIGGTYLIEQQNFLDSTNAANFTELAQLVGYPRVRFTSSLTYTPNDVWSVNWTVDWQSSQDIIKPVDFINNPDSRYFHLADTGNFARHDLTARWNVREDLSLRAGVVNVFDENQSIALGTTVYSNFDPYGRRFFVGLNLRR
nr:TonB-dependent receptor [uncultured Brevundimonas sp.]